MEKNQKIHCILLIFFLIILLFGDKIILKFINQKPNPNDKVFKENIEKETKYEIDFLSEITIEESLEKVKNNEEFILLSSRSRKECQTCEEYMALIKEELSAKDNVYYFDRSLYDKRIEPLKSFIEIDVKLKKNIQYTPYLMYFKDGKLYKELIGKKDKEELRNFLNN